VNSSSVSDTSKELTDIEFEKITAVGFPGIALIFALQSWFSERHFENWQALYILGLAIGILLSFPIRRTRLVKLAYYPITFYMLLAPLFIKSPTMTPWMSLGLLTFAISVYWSAIFSMRILVPQIVLLTTLQLWLVHKDLPSITDTRDMRLLHTYFSTIYVVGIAIALNLVRQRYVRATREIDEKIEVTLGQILSEMKRVSKVNRQDYRNLKLHGTTLNTLLFFRNQGKLKKNKADLSRLLKNEIAQLETLTKDTQIPMLEALQMVINNRSQSRVKVNSIKVSGEFKTRRTHEIIEEIVREMLLNLEKHTNASAVEITLNISHDERFKIELSDNSSFDDTEDSIQRAKRSASLSRLLSLVNATLIVRKRNRGLGLTYEVNGDPELSLTNPEKIVRDLRSAALTQFAIDIVKIGIFFGILDLIGYVFLNIKPLNFIAIATVTAIMFAYAFRFSNSNWLFYLTAILPLFLFPIAAYNVKSYSEVSYFPTLFNLVLSACFLVTLEMKGNILRWIPLVIFTNEAILIPNYLPDNSRDIFAGSTPAIPLITIFAIVVIRLRRKVAAEDLQQLRIVFEDKENILKMEKWLDEEYFDLLRDLGNFERILEQKNLTEGEIAHELNLRIQYIRSLLICSEHIESGLVRDLFKRLKNRYSRGLETRISLNGENFFQYDELIDFEKEFNEIAKHVQDLPFDLNLVRTDKLNMEFHFPELDRSREKKLKSVFKELNSKVNYLISVG
jgi:hypothetical protein